MGRIVVTEFVSLDGVMEAPGGGEGFKYEAWTFAFDRGAEGDQFKLDEALDAQALLLGRVTYERLFGQTGDQKTLRLVESRTVGEGIAILIYRPARDHGQASR